MADSRIPATVTIHQRGYAGSKALLVVRDGDKTLGSREITLGADGATQVETIFFVRVPPASRICVSRSVRWPAKRTGQQFTRLACWE